MVMLPKYFVFQQSLHIFRKFHFKIFKVLEARFEFEQLNHFKQKLHTSISNNISENIRFSFVQNVSSFCQTVSLSAIAIIKIDALWIL